MAYVQNGRDTAPWPQFIVDLQAWKDHSLLLCLTASQGQSQGGTRVSHSFPKPCHWPTAGLRGSWRGCLWSQHKLLNRALEMGTPEGSRNATILAGAIQREGHALPTLPPKASRGGGLVLRCRQEGEEQTGMGRARLESFPEEQEAGPSLLHSCTLHVGQGEGSRCPAGP